MSELAFVAIRLCPRFFEAASALQQSITALTTSAAAKKFRDVVSGKGIISSFLRILKT
jgi:hypothetical protein